MTTTRTEWTQPFDEFGPDESPVQIWRLRLGELGEDPGAVLRPLTVQSEHRRAERYRFDADRHRHLGGRALVRAVLGHRYDCSPRSISITEGLYGKPRLNGAQANEPALTFNIAHAEDVVVAAFSRTRPVGIDVESQEREADMEGLIQRVFTEPERQQWWDLPPARRSKFFFQVWTCKEAFLKATGHGLQRAPHTVECTYDADTVVGLDDAAEHSPPSPHASAARWALRSFSAAEGMAGAVVRKHSLPAALPCADASRFVSDLAPM